MLGSALVAVLGLATAATGGLIPGGGSQGSDCYAELDVTGVDPSDPVQVKKRKKVSCTDGDPCDTGECGDGYCDLSLRLCTNQDDPNLACVAPPSLGSIDVRKIDLQPPPTLEGAACGAPYELRIALKKEKNGKLKPGKAKVKVEAKAPKGTKPRKDADTYIIKCVARTNACPGLSCWDLDGDSVADASEDVDGNGVWDARDCRGSPGTPCWDLDGDGINDPAEDTNGDGLWNALDCEGVTTGTISGVVVDADTGALVQGATVTAEPLGAQLTTGADGAFRFGDSPFGVYTLTASAPSLVIQADVVVGDLTTDTTLDGVSLLAGQGVVARLALRRLDVEAINLTRVHSGGSPIYVTANCEMCHSDRSAETSADALLPPFHAMPTHGSLGCLFCHSDSPGVDVGNETGWDNESAATLRKQVDVQGTCAACHSCYPSDFCVAACPSPCP